MTIEKRRIQFVLENDPSYLTFYIYSEDFYHVKILKCKRENDTSALHHSIIRILIDEEIYIYEEMPSTILKNNKCRCETCVGYESKSEILKKMVT